MERKNWKPKRLADDIMRPADMKKSKMNRPISSSALTGQSSSSSTTSTAPPVKSKLDFRATSASALPKSLVASSSSLAPMSAPISSVRPPLDEKWSEFGDTVKLDVDNFNTAVEEAIAQDKFTRVAKLITAALNVFLKKKSECLTVEYRLLITIMSTVKKYGSKLNHCQLHRGLLHILSQSRNFTPAMQDAFLSILIILSDQQQVPLDKYYLIAFLNDAVGLGSMCLGGAQRSAWVEKESAKRLVANIIRPLGTVFPLRVMYTDCQIENIPVDYFPDLERAKPTDPMQVDVFMEFLRPWFDNLRGENPPKALLRALGWLSGHPEVRHFIASRLDIWLQNPKFQREAVELLLFLGCNIDAKVAMDCDVVDSLIRLRNLKNRQVMNAFCIAMRVATSRSQNNMIRVFDLLVKNELGPAQNRSSSNLIVMHTLLNENMHDSLGALAAVCAELLVKFEEISRLLRAFLKELIRSFTNMHNRLAEFSYSRFVEAFLNCVLDHAKTSDHGIQENVPIRATELACQLPLITCMSAISAKPDAFASRKQNDAPLPIEMKMAYDNFCAEYIAYCESTLRWLTQARLVFTESKDYIRAYFLLMFFEKRDKYTSVDYAAVNDAELSNCIRIFGECGINEKILYLIIGEVATSIPANEAIDIVRQIVHRAALNNRKNEALIVFKDPLKFIDRAFQVTAFMPLDTRTELLPQLANSSLYWTTWNIVLTLVCGGGIVDDFEKIYSSYPTLRLLIHMIMTRKFELAQVFEGKSPDEMRKIEQIEISREFETIGKYETVLGNKIGSFACLLAPRGQVRAPPVSSDIRGLSDRLRLAAQLCRCRQPPLLDSLVDNVGAKLAMPAVKELLSIDPTAVDSLSSGCLCHALLFYVDSKDKNDDVVNALLARVRSHMESTDNFEDDVLLKTLLGQLASTDSAKRTSVVNVFRCLYPVDADNEIPFDLKKIVHLPKFLANRVEYLKILANASIVENDTALAKAYVKLVISVVDNSSMHEIAGIISKVVSANRPDLRECLAEFYLAYIDKTVANTINDQNEILNLPRHLTAVEIAGCTVALHRSTPAAIVSLLAKSTNGHGGEPQSQVEMLIELWLTKIALPRFLVKNASGEIEKRPFSLNMRREMLRSKDQRVVDAALHDLSKYDANELVFTSQMANETAAKLLNMADNMDVSSLPNEKLRTLGLVLKGYQLKGVTAGKNLFDRTNARLQDLHAKSEVKDEFCKPPIELTSPPIMATIQNRKPIGKMDTKAIEAWLRTNFAANSTNPSSLPMSFVNSALHDESSSLACLRHVEVNLKFYLAHPPQFHVIVVLIDACAVKYSTIKKRLETLSTRLLKSVSPPPSVASILKKHATSVASLLAQKPQDNITNVYQLSGMLKKVTNSAKRKSMVFDYVVKFEIDNYGKQFKTDELGVLLKLLAEVCASSSVASQFIASRWPTSFRREICYQLLSVCQPTAPARLVMKLIDEYCATNAKTAFRHLFAPKNDVPNQAHMLSFAQYASKAACEDENSSAEVMATVSKLVESSGIDFVLSLARETAGVLSSNMPSEVRSAAEKLMKTYLEEYPYLRYDSRVPWNVRAQEPVESREACHRRCEVLIDKLVELEDNASAKLTEMDECDEDEETEKGPERKEETKGDTRKRPGEKWDRGRMAKKPKWEKEESEEDASQDFSIQTTIAQLTTMLTLHPHIVKTKFPVLANFVAQVSAMQRKDIRTNNRVRKVEIVLLAVQQLADSMDDDELSAVESAITSAIEFYKGHIEEGVVHVREQISYADFVLRACVAFLKRSLNDARDLFRDQRVVLERVCKRACDRGNADLLADLLASL